MDIDKSLEHLKQTADKTLLKELTFAPQMAENVRQKIKTPKRLQRNIWYGATAVAAALLLLLMTNLPLHITDSVGSDMKQREMGNQFPGIVWQVPSLWKPSPLQTASNENYTFSYYGEKPVRIITDELYEDQGQKVMWLLNGSFASKVELIAVNEQGTQIKLGSFDVGGPLYDADGSFPSGVALPYPGIWKIQVLSDGKFFGSVFVNIKEGVSPANMQLLKPLVERYLKSNEFFSGKEGDATITVDIFGAESSSAERKTVYAWVKALSKNPVLSSGVSAPMVFEIAYDGNEYKVISYKMPKDGNQYAPSIAEMFPPKYQEKLKRVNQP